MALHNFPKGWLQLLTTVLSTSLQVKLLLGHHFENEATVLRRYILPLLSLHTRVLHTFDLDPYFACLVVYRPEAWQGCISDPNIDMVEFQGMSEFNSRGMMNSE